MSFALSCIFLRSPFVANGLLTGIEDLRLILHPYASPVIDAEVYFA